MPLADTHDPRPSERAASRASYGREPRKVCMRRRMSRLVAMPTSAPLRTTTTYLRVGGGARGGTRVTSDSARSGQMCHQRHMHGLDPDAAMMRARVSQRNGMLAQPSETSEQVAPDNNLAVAGQHPLHPRMRSSQVDRADVL